jgi:hypothetical protein
MGILGRPRRRKDGAGDNAQTAARENEGAIRFSRGSPKRQCAPRSKTGQKRKKPLKNPAFLRLLTVLLGPHPPVRYKGTRRRLSRRRGRATRKVIMFP